MVKIDELLGKLWDFFWNFLQIFLKVTLENFHFQYQKFNLKSLKLSRRIINIKIQMQPSIFSSISNKNSRRNQEMQLISRLSRFSYRQHSPARIKTNFLHKSTNQQSQFPGFSHFSFSRLNVFNRNTWF